VLDIRSHNIPQRKIMNDNSEPLNASEKRNEDICIALFAAGALVGLYQLRYGPISFNTSNEMVSIAKNLAEHGSYANPNAVLETGPTAANPPLYPLYLALLMKILRNPVWFYWAAATSNIIANAFTASWLPRVSKLFYGSMVPGIFGSVLWLAAMQLSPSWDTGITVAGLLLFCTFSASSLGTEKRSVRVLFAGAFAGLLALLNPSTLLIVMPWIAFQIYRTRLPLRQMAILFAAMLLVISVWVGRNYQQFGVFVLRTNLGFTLYASNNDCAESSLIADGSRNCYQTHHPNGSLRESQLLRSMGEVAYDRQRTADAVSWMKMQPAKFWLLTVERFRDFWLPPLSENPFQAPAIWAITLLSIPGLALMIKRRQSATLFLLSVLLIYPVMYYVVVSDVRYRYPVLWISLLPAGYLLWQIYSRILARRTP
jgi:hypothetical protein